MKIGDTVKIKECALVPELVGEDAEIVDMQIQEYEKCRLHPIWAKIASGECRGKICGFREGEVELLPKGDEAQNASNKEERKTMKTKIIEQVEEILTDVATVEEVVEIERVTEEAKGKILVELGLDFWVGKTPCWEMSRCPEAVRRECPAFKYQSLPCWEIKGTYCKLDDHGATGIDTSICQICQVYKRYGHGEPRRIKLFSKGIDTSLRSLAKGGGSEHAELRET